MIIITFFSLLSLLPLLLPLLFLFFFYIFLLLHLLLLLLFLFLLLLPLLLLLLFFLIFLFFLLVSGYCMSGFATHRNYHAFDGKFKYIVNLEGHLQLDHSNPATATCNTAAVCQQLNNDGNYHHNLGSYISRQYYLNGNVSVLDFTSDQFNPSIVLLFAIFYHFL